MTNTPPDVFIAIMISVIAILAVVYYMWKAIIFDDKNPKLYSVCAYGEHGNPKVVRGACTFAEANDLIVHMSTNNPDEEFYIELERN